MGSKRSFEEILIIYEAVFMPHIYSFLESHYPYNGATIRPLSCIFMEKKGGKVPAWSPVEGRIATTTFFPEVNDRTCRLHVYLHYI